MGKGRQPPKLLSRVLRTVAELHESKGSSVAHIADHIKKELTEHGRLRRNIALEIRRALKYAVDIGALIVKSGKYRTAERRRVIPVDSLEIVMDCRHKKTRQKQYVVRKKQRCRPRFYRKHGGDCAGDMHKRKKITKRKRKPKKQSNVHDTKAQQQEQQKSQPIKQQPPPPSPSNSGTDKESSYAPSTTPGPHDKSQDLDKKKNNRDQDGRHQTPYPEYNDSMHGDDKKDLNKVRGRPRRPRRPILPTAQNLFDGDPNFQDPTNGMTFALSCLLLITLWYGYRT